MFCSTDLTTVLLYNFDNNTSTPHGRAITFLDTSSQTFVSGGATTAYGTQVVGTRLENGHVVGQVLSTTSRVLYDSSKVGSPIEANEIKAETGKDSFLLKLHFFFKLFFPDNDILPTYTISNTFTPFTFEWNPQSTRSAKALSNDKLSSVTYFGFADFSTTVGDTVVFFKPSTTAVREIEPTEIKQIQPTKMFLPEIAFTPTVKLNEVTEVNEIKEVKQELQNSVIPEVKEEKQKTAKALFQEEKVVEKEEIVPVTEAVSYEEGTEDDEENETEESEEPGED